MDWPTAFQQVFGGVQSALAPAGVEADAVLRLTLVMSIGAGAVLLVVCVVTLLALGRRKGRGRWLAGGGLVVWGGIVFPVVVLSALLVYGLVVMRDGPRNDHAPALTIDVVGEQFWWRVRYLGADGEPVFETANEIHLPVDRTVRFRLSTADVIHSFWIPVLAGKLDMIPGRVNELTVRATRTGLYRGQCAEYCGGAHALMAFDVVVHDEDGFRRWTDRQRHPTRAPSDPVLADGLRLFGESGCGACHTIRGTPHAGRLGPDLSNVGARRTIAAGLLPTNVGTLAGWIADAQTLKPTSRMPSYRVFEGEELRHLSAYLESLK